LKQVDSAAQRAGVVDARTGALGQYAWGLLYLTWQRLDLAAAPYERALAYTLATPQPDQALRDAIRHGLVTAYSGLGRFEDSARVARDLLASFERRPSVGELRIAQAQYDLGQALFYEGRLDEATPLLDTAAKVAAQRLGAGSPSTAMMETTRCELLAKRKQTELALDCFLALYGAIQATAETPRWIAAITLGNAGILQGELKRSKLALQTLTRARADLAAAKGPAPVRQFLDFYLAVAHWRQGQASAALPLLNDLEPTVLQSVEPDAPWPQRIALLQGLLMDATRRSDEARSLLATAVAQLAGMALKDPEPLLTEAKATLARLH
jgi:tetratricopeptide (TPR) repeat protein